MANAYNFLETAKYYCTLSIMEYNRPKPFEPGKFNLRKLIRLPLPQELRDDTAVAYNNVDLKLVGDIANKSIGTGLASEGLRQAFGVNAAVQGLAGGAKALGGASGMGTALAGQVGGAIGDAIDPEAVASVFQQGLGVAPNPNPSVAFQGPSLREMSYTWTFMPTNQKDSQHIREIVNYLKAAALPRADVSINSAAILEYPSLVQMNFFPWDNNGRGHYGWSDENSIIKMKRCFMSSVNVNYTSGAAPSFFAGKNNEPTIIQLSINMKEIEYFMAHDYEKGANSKGLLQGFDDLFQGIFNADYQETPPDNNAQDGTTDVTAGATT